jgi:predicted TIM-barrel enzyme
MSLNYTDRGFIETHANRVTRPKMEVNNTVVQVENTSKKLSHPIVAQTKATQSTAKAMVTMGNHTSSRPESKRSKQNYWKNLCAALFLEPEQGLDRQQ